MNDELEFCIESRDFFQKQMKDLLKLISKQNDPSEKRRLQSLYKHAEKDWKKYVRLINNINSQIRLEKSKRTKRK